MRIIVDGFGGDNAPLATLQGCELAINEYGVDITITGDENELKKVAKQNNIDISKMEVVHTTSVIPVCADPTTIMSDYKDSSMAVAFQLLAKGEGDAVVCAGSTGAIVVGASLIVKRIKGIKRAALAPIMPSDTGCYILMDVGANIECRPEMLLHFGVMGSIYMEKIMNIQKPRVALVNIGAEETKGRELELGAYQLFSESKVLNFTGNIEPRYIPLGDADVVITDGFTGNVILKLTEGLGKMFAGNIKNMFGGFSGKLAGAMVLPKIKAFKNKMDYTEYGGAPLLGTAKPVIKAHGSSNAKAFKNAIRQARDFVEKGVIDEISTSIAKIKEQDTKNEA
ncbi:phosphate acyltransferase PlsX [Paludicola sp. MB14-C6]|uniref:phosphate acyltransferase PlsX n=1 Tax=Paludihabitans sp. MB14-C6 TaxID=3070656 RepID=UPI0027DB112D|nr:phosphate acyltransferase PlsX [Paludicola sp. MB14-C6]WMJ23686.1 phosphate acyltransferase PlsX [Paludicola sp. MB14-C6]